MCRDMITDSYKEVDYVERDPHGFWENVGYYIFN